MATRTSIEWTETTWKPVNGCMKYSAGCQNCYAEILNRRLKAMKTQAIVVCSMSILFYKSVSADFIKQVLDIILQPQEERMPMEQL